MKTIVYGFLYALALWFIANNYGWPIAVGVGVAVVLFFIWIRRAALLTQLAMQAYFIKGDAVKGEKYFRRAHKTGSMSPECKLQYSAFCLRENDFKTGRRLLYEIINSTTVQRSQKLDAKHNMAVLMWKEGNIDEAIEYLEEVHEEKPATNTYGTLGVLYLERAKANNKYDDIMDFMLEAYDYNESDKTIADNLGETYLCMGEYEKAKEVYETLLTAEFVTPMPYYNYGLVLKSLGENEKAKQQFEKALTCRFTSVLTVTREMIEQEIEKLA